MLPLERFERFVIKLGENQCWLWSGAIAYGYGAYLNNERAHRYAYRTYKCEEIPKGKMVLHNCSKKSCVNPRHLYLGNAAENTDFAWKNDECRIGANHILTKREVLEIRAIWAKAIIVHPKRPNRRLPSQEEIAKRYGVSASCISNTVTEKTGKGILRGNSDFEGTRQCQ